MGTLQNSGDKYSETATPRRHAGRWRPQYMGAARACDKRSMAQRVQVLAPARPQPVNSQAIQGRYGEEKS
ncbi:hypothetical protein XspCFBP7912_07840 [Xanthomonas sp. CFBP 7912]|nr:hypothetical protein XspCFBP7912_07840 [Xanthomonas sp. CFBP 7912]